MTFVRPLDDADLPALLALLAPTEPRSMFLVGNATEYGIADRGGALNGLWMGAFEGDALRGVLAWFRGPDSITPACEGHEDALVPALLARLSHVPRVVIGTSDRVRVVRERLPPAWEVALRQREVLLTLTWDRYRRPDDRAATPLPPERAPEAAALIGLLHRTWSIPSDAGRNLETARRLTAAGRALVRERDGRAVAMSCEAVSSGRYAHVGATVCEPEHRRRGHARACVAAVIERARDAGRASLGATLFTAEENHGAIALYESMGFARDAAWEMCFLRT